MTGICKVDKKETDYEKIRIARKIMHEAFDILDSRVLSKENFLQNAEICRKLYDARTIFLDVVKNHPDSDWVGEAVNRIQWASKITERLTKRFLSDIEESEIMNI